MGLGMLVVDAVDDTRVAVDEVGDVTDMTEADVFVSARLRDKELLWDEGLESVADIVSGGSEFKVENRLCIVD